MTLAQVVLDFRSKLKKTQEVLGREMGVNPRMITRLESGWNPSQNALLRLAEIAKKYSQHEYAHYFRVLREKMVQPEGIEPPKEIPPVSMDDLREWELKLTEAFWRMSSIVDKQRNKMDGWASQVLGEYLGDIEAVRASIQVFTQPPKQVVQLDPEALAAELLSEDQPPVNKSRRRKFARAYEKQIAAAAKKMRQSKQRKPRKTET